MKILNQELRLLNFELWHWQLTFNYALCIMNYELFQGVPAPLRSAVGLSAISFSASLQKDAAPIPNALEATISKVLTQNNNS